MTQSAPLVQQPARRLKPLTERSWAEIGHEEKGTNMACQQSPADRLGSGTQESNTGEKDLTRHFKDVAGNKNIHTQDAASHSYAQEMLVRHKNTSAQDGIGNSHSSSQKMPPRCTNFPAQDIRNNYSAAQDMPPGRSNPPAQEIRGLDHSPAQDMQPGRTNPPGQEIKGHNHSAAQDMPPGPTNPPAREIRGHNQSWAHELSPQGNHYGGDDTNQSLSTVQLYSQVVKKGQHDSKQNVLNTKDHILTTSDSPENHSLRSSSGILSLII
jgi:hypothetical protein